MNTWAAKRIFGDNQSQNPAGALLNSGAGRADGSTIGDTWIFLDTIGGTSTPWGFKHAQGDNKIVFIGGGTTGAWVELNTGNTYLLGKIGIGYDPNTSGNSHKLYVNGTTLHTNHVYFANGTAYYINSSGSANLLDITGRSLGVSQIDGTGIGLSLYNGAKATSIPEYGITFALTANLGRYGDVQGDWATYFTMNTNNQRGWIFKTYNQTDEAYMAGSISARGVATFKGLAANSQYIVFPAGGSYATQTTTITGALKITLPQYQTNTMITFDVTIYTYSTRDTVVYHISGYEYGANGWHGPISRVYSEGTGSKTNLPVRFCLDDNNKVCITIGEINTTWEYPQIAISNILCGYSRYSADYWGAGWGISFITTLPSTVTNTLTNVNTQNITASAVAWANVTGKPLYSRRTVGTLDWNTYSEYVMTNAAIAHWNGAYSDTASNLAYCDRGRFGTIVTAASDTYVKRSGDTMTGVLTATSGTTLQGIKIGDVYINAINKNLIMQNCDEIRFGTSAWDYNCWAGMRYDNTNKNLYIGFAYYPMTRNNETTGTIYFSGATSLRPYANGSGTLGSSDYEWGTTYSREVYARHFDSSANVSGDYNIYYGYNRCTNHYFYRGATGGGRVHVATINATGISSSGDITAANNIGIYNNGSQGGSKKGISLYNGSGNVLSYGLLFELTSQLGTHYTCNQDWATYFTMDGATNRGWIFRHNSRGNIASINCNGCMALGFKSNNLESAHRLCLVPPYHSGGPWYIDAYDPNTSYAYCDFLYNTSHVFQIRHDGHVWASAAFHNAVWNDLAECRKSSLREAGYAITPAGSCTTKRLEPACRITSDTWGFVLGDNEDENKMPVAIAGRVLAYPYRDKSNYKIGDAVCSAPGGTIDIMTREEIKEYPDRIIGIVNEIPDYDIWEPSMLGGGRGPIHTDGRIWIDVR